MAKYRPCDNCGAVRKRERDQGICIAARPKGKPTRYYCAKPGCQAAASAYLGVLGTTDLIPKSVRDRRAREARENREAAAVPAPAAPKPKKAVKRARPKPIRQRPVLAS